MEAGLAAVPTLARELGARGSRGAVADGDPTAGLTPDAMRVLAGIPAWWEARARAAGLDERWADVEWAVQARVPPAVDLVGGRDLAGLSSTAVGQAYVTALDPSVRARHGRHYTPDDLAARVWDTTRAALGAGAPSTRVRALVRDPAAGGGALLVPVLREHLHATVRVDPVLAVSALPQILEGIDTDPAAAWVASVVLAAECLPAVAAIPARLRRPLPELVHVGDGLASRGPAGAVIMNPPYGRVKLNDADRERWSEVLHGHANLYGLFMAHGAESLDRHGVLAALVPTSWTSGLYFSKLRDVLSRDLTLRTVTFVQSRSASFTGVLQETCIAVFSRRRATYTHISLANGAVHNVARVRAPRGSHPWVLPRRADDAPVAAAAGQMPLTLATAGWRVSTGPLVWNRRRTHLHARPGKGRLPVVWGADIKAGVVQRDAARNSHRYLKIVDDADAKVMVLDVPSILVQRTTAPEQARRLVVANLTADALAEWGGKVVVENHVNVLRPSSPTPLISRDTLARVLGTPTLDKVMRSISGSVAVSATELEAIPLPGPEILASWAALDGDALDNAVAVAYGDRHA